MKGQVHYICVPEPNLKEGRDLIANCGANVENAQFAGEAIHVSGLEPGATIPIDNTKDCGKCWQKGFDKSYIYPIVENKKRGA